MSTNESGSTSKNAPTFPNRVKESTFVSSTTPLDLASKPDVARSSFTANSGTQKAPAISVTNVPVRVRYTSPKQDSKQQSTPAVRHKVLRGPVPVQPVARPCDPRSAPRAPFIVEQLVRMSEPRPRYNASPGTNQAIRVTLPLQKVISEQPSATSGTPTITVTTAHTMASIVRGGKVPHSTTIQPVASQNQLSSNTGGPAPYTSHMPRGPAAIASITVPKSAAVATPIVRPSFTVTQLPTPKTSVGGSNPTQQVPMSLSQPNLAADLHIKDSGIQLSTPISIARHQIPLNVPSTMFVTPVRNTPSGFQSVPEKQRIPETSLSGTISGEKIITSSQHTPHHLVQHVQQSNEKGYKPVSGITVAITSGTTSGSESITIKSSTPIGSQLSAALTAPHSHSHSTAAQGSNVPYAGQTIQSVAQAQNLVAPHPTVHRAAIPQQKSSQIVHTVAPIALQCQPANKSAISLTKNVMLTSATTSGSSASIMTRPKSGVVTTASTSVPVAKVYPQQASSQARNQPADLSGRGAGLSPHSFAPIRLPTGITAVPASVPITSTINMPLSSSHISSSDRPAVAVDISQGLSYNAPSSQSAYYYGHHKLERSSQNVQTSTLRPATTIRPAGTHSQPVKLGQMVVTVNPSRPHQVALHNAAPATADSIPNMPESGSSAAQPLPTIYTLTTTIATATPSGHNSSSYSAASATASSASTTTASHPPMSSPRPSILRKRPSEVSVSGIRKNLMSGSLGAEPDSSARQVALLKSPMKTSEVGHDRHVGDKIVIKQEPMETGDTGNDTPLAIETPSSNGNGSTGTPAYETSPRKKPRKQQLLAIEMKEVHSSDGEEKLIKSEKDKSEIKPKVKPTIKEAEEVAKWESVRKQQMTLMNTYRHSWKSRHNHFLRPSDIKCKDEKKQTVNDLANQKHISQKINGWKLYHLSIQMDDLADHEDSIHDRLTGFLSLLEGVQSKSRARGDYEKEFHKTNELLKGNLQRCRLIRDQMHESKAQVFKVFDHKPHILGIIKKYVSKRSLKKRERM